MHGQYALALAVAQPAGVLLLTAGCMMMWLLRSLRVVGSASCQAVRDGRVELDARCFVIMHGQPGQVLPKLVRPWDTGQGKRETLRC
jgi:hypothetical protein